ncbi:hypothetical protein Glove_114g108 [Diversispora epigaea]|uniref:Uncharacterized protein n=1 Tax=Diversispora epigaea TaxID=1348612 RepID=A0A397JBK3_9GLOM|nr:hypothetical protein Glove_114g108 [Diversispora epigaea]
MLELEPLNCPIAKELVSQLDNSNRYNDDEIKKKKKQVKLANESNKNLIQCILEQYTQIQDIEDEENENSRNVM